MPALDAPRIYNLFPLLAGPIDQWPGHLARIATMGFDWVLLNPFHYPGASGSLYAVRDYDRVHPVLAGEDGEDWEPGLTRFCSEAAERGLRVMVDLVLTHVARDAALVGQEPAWFALQGDDSPTSPAGTDPTDPRSALQDSQLAEFRYDDPALLEGQLAFWRGLIGRYRACGVSGFRCDAAHRVPAGVWQSLITLVRHDDPGVVFAGWTLGGGTGAIGALPAARFDLVFNSVRWWDFRSGWLFDEAAALGRVAPAVSFPESYDTPRLMRDIGVAGAAAEARYRVAYGFAATFSAGVMVPMGFEYGFSQPLDVCATRPGQWAAELEHRPFDLSAFIADINALKAATPALGAGGSQRRLSAPGAPWVALERRDRDGRRALVVLNPRLHRATSVDPARLANAAGTAAFAEVTPGVEPAPFVPGEPVSLPAGFLRLYMESPQQRPRRRARSRPQQVARLEALAEHRVAIEKVTPEVDGGRFPVKRIVGDVLEVEADIFADGHEQIRAAVQFREVGSREWREAPLAHAGNDRWQGRVPLTALGRVEYTIAAWRDRFRTWRDEVSKKVAADQDVSVEMVEGQALVAEARDHARGEDRKALARRLAALERAKPGAGLSVLMETALLALMDRAGPRANLTHYGHVLEVVVDRPQAVFAAWYEMFPRSQSPVPGRHGTFRDVIRRLPYVRDLGFDVLYFTPIHPIGRSNRKGRNNTLDPRPEDPGSVYAIGSEEGGHMDVHPELGTLEDFRALVAAAHEHGLEIALDFAVQCSPDHPWLKSHPEWFDWRPDGSIKYAENPPKKYQDIVNVHFYRDAIPGLWLELKQVFDFWIGQGVKTFRVDNPHTKPLPFWEWVIGEVKAEHPEVIFLSEAFTRPKVMLRLAKLGFTQSYTYFTWRNHKHELAAYLEELAHTEAREVFRPNFFVNTPDINPAVLQTSERAAYEMRFVLAATLSGVYGIYNGFEICEGTPLPGKEEYLDSEKYEIRHWDFDRPGNIKALIRRVNAIRRESPALWTHLNVRFLNAWNDHVLYYLKMTPERDDAVLVMVNMDHQHVQETLFEVPLWEFGLPDDATIGVEDLLEGHHFSWTGKLQRISLDPGVSPARIWRLLPPDAT